MLPFALRILFLILRTTNTPSTYSMNKTHLNLTSSQVKASNLNQDATISLILTTVSIYIDSNNYRMLVIAYTMSIRQSVQW